MKIAALLVLVAMLACANPNRRSPAKYEWCNFLKEMELYKLGLRDCDDSHYGQEGDTL